MRTVSSKSLEYPTRVTTPFRQFWATVTAVAREASYPQAHVSSQWLSWATPPPIGHVLIILAYWTVIICYMVWDSIVYDAYFWERIGFRNAWVTVMQVPLLFLLSTKSGILGLFAGLSYERMNWMHRWVARTMLLTASMHGWHFYQEWAIADFVQLELQMMPMVAYGIGAWAILAFQFIVGFAPIRHLSYEVFVIQHIVSGAFFLWLLWVHVPAYAMYHIWFAIAVLSFDRLYRIFLLAWQNVKLSPSRSRCQGGQRIGHKTQIQRVGDAITVLTIKDVHFRWQPGQHLSLWVPRIGVAEAHPYTIACAHTLKDACVCNSIQLVVRKHGGFSKRLHEFATKAKAANKSGEVTAFVTGPFGRPPRWEMYETLVLISASTGASFTLPILECALQRRQRAVCTRRIDFLLCARQGEEVSFYVQRLQELISEAAEVDIELNACVAITRDPARTPLSETSSLRKLASSSSGVDIKLAEGNAAAGEDCYCAAPAGDLEKSANATARYRSTSIRTTDSHIVELAERPDIGRFIRRSVEITGGETSVVVCGGRSLVSSVRNCVASLSDERAVHKGSGAQGIHLHVEEYSL
jgi:NAD(P)H-flavin reductase